MFNLETFSGKWVSEKVCFFVIKDVKFEIKYNDWTSSEIEIEYIEKH